ncbi:ATP synthase F1 subunit gamma [Patescibacteria group bacterium]|nr:ATP synthase F1 subunit gamma [Patescibacteria group bacterium]
MANVKLIRRRMKSVHNIGQITRAMEMVAASKMKKAQDQAVMGKPYAEKISQVVRELVSTIEKKYHPLLSAGNPDGKTAIILISSNKGMCGGLNANLFRMLVRELHAGPGTDIVTIGKKGEQFAARAGLALVADFSGSGSFTEAVPAVTQFVIEKFLDGTYKTVLLAYNVFETALRQTPSRNVLLPLAMRPETDRSERVNFREFLMEPGPSEILTNLLPHYLENQVRSAVYEAEASFYSAQMIAMKNATDAAHDFEHELSLLYNKARQEKITYEIADMVTARMAVA